MSKHTDGPFFVVTDNSLQDEFGNGPILVAVSVHEDDTADAICWINNDLPQWEANAKLLSAAPDLLGIVERIFYSINGLSATLAATNRDYACSTLRKETAEVIRLSQLAIAKAKGGE
jgi:hypothetical protein